MEWIKQLWLWVVLLVIAIVLVVIRIVVIGDYIAAEEQNLKQLANLKNKVDATTRRLSQLPTKGDIEQAQNMRDAIEAEGRETAGLWLNASTALNALHEQDPGSFPVYLHRQCRLMAESLAAALPRLRARTLAEALATAGGEVGPRKDDGSLDVEKILNLHGFELPMYERLLSEDASPMRYWASDPDAQQIVSLEKDFAGQEETVLPWRQYLISNRIHQHAAEVAAVLEAGYVEPAENEIPEVVPTLQVRTIESLGEITFGDKKRVRLPEDGESEGATGTEGREGRTSPTGRGRTSGRSAYGGREAYGGRSAYGGETATPSAADVEDEAPVASYDVYPVAFDIVAHPRVVAAFLRRMLADTEMLFVPVSVEIRRYDERATQPTGKVADVMAIRSDEIPAEVRPSLLVGHEPPVRAQLQYRVFHFLRFDLPQEDGDGEGDDGAER